MTDLNKFGTQDFCLIIQAASFLDYTFETQQKELVEEFLASKHDKLTLAELSRVFMALSFQDEFDSTTQQMIGYLNKHFSKHIQYFSNETASEHLSSFIEIAIGLVNCRNIKANDFIWRKLINQTILQNMELLTSTTQIISFAALSINTDMSGVSDKLPINKKYNNSINFFEDYLLYYALATQDQPKYFVDEMDNSSKFIYQLHEYEKQLILDSFNDPVKFKNRVKTYADILESDFELFCDIDKVIKTDQGLLFYAVIHLKEQKTILLLINDISKSSKKLDLLLQLKSKVLSKEGIKMKVLGASTFLNDEYTKYIAGDAVDIDDLREFRSEAIEKLFNINYD